MCVCETNLNVTDYRNICAVNKRKTSKSRDVLQWCCICTIKMAEQILTRNGEAIEP